MKRPSYFDKTKAFVGDIITAGRVGQCRVLRLNRGELKLRNVITGEILYALSNDCDLIDRK